MIRVMDMDVSDLNALAVDLGKVSAGVTRKSIAAIAKTAYDIEATAKTFVPVDTGNLKNSISTSAIGLTAEIGPTAEYGRYVEEGTSVMAPQAYMGPAYDRHAGDLVTALEKITGDIL